MNSLIYAQIKQINHSKFLLVELMISPLVLLFFSYNCNNSWLLSPSCMVLMGAALIATLSSEILHIVTVDEMKNGTFDIILISQIKPIEIIVGKIVLSVTTTTLIAFVSIIINNILSFNYKFHMINIRCEVIILVLTVALFCGLAELISLLLCRRQNKVVHSYILVAGILFALVFIYLMDRELHTILAVLNVMVFLFEILIILCLLGKKYQVFKSERMLFASIFNKGNNIQLEIFIKKNILALRLQNNALLKIIIVILLPIIGAILCYYNKNISGESVFALSVASMQTFFVVCLILNTYICENSNNIGEVLQVAGKKSGYRIFEKCLTVTFVTSIVALCDYICINVFLVNISIACILYTILNNFIISLICANCCKNVRQYKYVEQFKLVISVICIFFQSLGLIICNLI